MPKCVYPLLLLIGFGISQANAQKGILESYIRQGLDSNLALRQKNFDLQRADIDLQRARSLFYPSAGFSSQYTLADGGRTQSIPVGDLLNNVYSTLNQLTASNKFPRVANQSIQFLPDDYHDTKLEVSLPLLNTDLIYNRQISEEQINGRRADADVYKRELVKQIKQAYYQYLQAGKAVDIFSNALGLVKENLRVSEKMVENRMATREIVLRAKAQVSQVESSLTGARNDEQNAAAFFNFLLDRPLEEPISTDTTLMDEPVITSYPGQEPATGEGAERREELAKVRSIERMQETNLRWSRSWIVPKLSAFYDVGFQGFGFHFDNSQFYQLAGVQLQWTLFKGGDNRYRVSRAGLDVASVRTQYEELSKQLSLQVQTASNNYRSALDAMRSTADEVTSARETYRLAERRFDEGQALQIEVIDARTQLTGSELRYSLGRLAVLNRAAELERATAGYKL